MLGYDHRPKNTLFGSAKMILKPSYNAKLEAFTKDFRAHLIKKDWNGKVIMDMFDEPLDQYYDMINQVVTRIRAIAPEWKFTYAEHMLLHWKPVSISGIFQFIWQQPII